MATMNGSQHAGTLPVFEVSVSYRYAATISLRARDAAEAREMVEAALQTHAHNRTEAQDNIALPLEPECGDEWILEGAYNVRGLTDEEAAIVHVVNDVEEGE